MFIKYNKKIDKIIRRHNNTFHNIYILDNEFYIYGGNKWNKFGSLDSYSTMQLYGITSKFPVLDNLIKEYDLYQTLKTFVYNLLEELIETEMF